MVISHRIVALGAAAVFTGLFAASTSLMTSPVFATGTTCTQMGALDVTVVDQHNFPLGDVSLTAVERLHEGDQGADTGSATTDETGRATILGLELYGSGDECDPTTYDVTATKSECGSKTVAVAINDDIDVPSHQMLHEDLKIALTCNSSPSPSITLSPVPTSSYTP